MSCGHPCECPTYRDHLKSINFSAAAMPTRHRRVSEIATTEKRWDKDMRAYAAMRKDGVQPVRIDGAAEMQARASTQVEVESGHLMNNPNAAERFNTEFREAAAS